MAKKVFIIHGWEGTPESGWKPWLKKELEARDFEVSVPAMPDTLHPKKDAWVGHLAQVVGTPDKDTYIVGHSLGCITTLRFLESLPENVQIGGVILVAGFAMNLPNPDFSETYPFTNDPLAWDKIKSHCQKFVAIHSDNDPYVPIENGKLFEEKLGAEFIILPGMMHFAEDEGIFKIPEVLTKLLEISKKNE